MEAIRYFFELVASFVMWIGIPVLVTLAAEAVLQRVNPKTTNQPV